ncbi:hypothetical protein OE88DRAFT_1666411 [Heliocybe sulcata]|uniref:F-box domain-containing protein n=1 Tax=Heliocybe sulcata TaxID=5364 RepID=A0A5C3MP30_9AGAM|nr:hypothetical protein OE88DRAFT_1666411 [Heliocybe sulcata]
MHNRPTEAHPKSYRLISTSPKSHRAQFAQYDRRKLAHKSFSILLEVPSETLTHVTSFLDPNSLFALAGTNKRLYDHVKDDNTWHRAFLCQFLGIGPENDPHDGNSLMLRRAETSWRREFVSRYNLRRRWSRSRNTPISHVPTHSSISGMHLMSESALLTSSLQYGIVSRSVPLNGKILRGFLDAGGALNGLGNGNPNAEFSPNVTACALTSDGGTAKIAWGFTNGEVAMTTAASAMNHGSRAAAKYARCKAAERHEGVVDNVIWDSSMPSRPVIVTGSSDGRVKVWDAREFRCVWTSAAQDLPVPDPCVKIASNISSGLVVCLARSGDVHVWTGVTSLPETTQSIRHFRVTPPAPTKPVENYDHNTVAVDPRALNGSATSAILLSRDESSSFQRITFKAETGQTEWTTFGDDDTGTICCVYPSFSTKPGEASFVIVGDDLGYIRIFDWNASSSSSAIPAYKQFEAHDDGPVTAISWNNIALATGSSRGALKIWDSLTFDCLRVIASASPRGIAESVSQIILERDMVVASVASRAVAMKVDRVGRDDKSKGKKSAKVGKRGDTAKWRQQLELYRDIDESRQVHEQEQSYVRSAFGRERAQHATLEGLGLSEAEAVEYILMLSREEEEQRLLSSASQSPMQLPVIEDEGVFQVDFDDLTPGTASSRVDVPRAPARRTPQSTSPPSTYFNVNGRSLPRTSPSPSNHKVQVSPRFRAEPQEAGPSITPLNIGKGSLPRPVRIPSISDDFPGISPTPSSTGTSLPSVPGSISKTTSLGSLDSRRNAWATPLSRSVSSSDAMPSPGSSPGVARVPSSGQSLLSADIARHGTIRQSPPAEYDEDAELKFAIELSLAEARSRGDDM